LVIVINQTFVENQMATVEVINASLSLDIVTNSTVENASITVTYSAGSPVNESLGVPDLNKYVRIEVIPELNSSISFIILKMFYTDAEVASAGLNESSLGIYWYSGTEWVKLGTNLSWVYGTGVNMTGEYVWANVSQFGIYTVGGDRIITTTTTTTTTTSTTATTAPTTTTSTTTTTTRRVHRSGGGSGDGGAVTGELTPTCHDGILNQGESGIDCGGPCKACSTTTTMRAATTTVALTTLPLRTTTTTRLSITTTRHATTTTKPAVTTTTQETATTMPAAPGIAKQLTTWENAPVIGGILLVLVILAGFFVYAAKEKGLRR
jgi:hypothetical protein